MTVETLGKFITFPVVSVTGKVIDLFDIGVAHDNIVAVTGLDGFSKNVAEGGKSAVHFKADTGLRPIISTATVEEILEHLDTTTFIMYDVVSVTDGPDGKKYEERFTSYTDADQIVGVNDLSGTTQQVTDDVKSIIYFKPSSALRPTLSSEEAAKIIDRVNEV